MKGFESQEIQEELQLKEDECCIVFDFGCYFPYANYEDLRFDFQLGMETFNDYKMNHRYPNKFYQTITKKYGRKTSKLGYPYVMKLKEQAQPFLLGIVLGIKEKHMKLIFSIQTNMTKEKPVCGLSLRYMFTDNKFHFVSCEKVKDYEWYNHIWRNYEPEEGERKDERDIVLRPAKVTGSNTIIYKDVITPFPSSLSGLILI